MANPYRDANGHWTTKENDGGPCKHSDGKHQTRINKGQHQMRLNENSDWLDISEEEFKDVRASAKPYSDDENNDDDFGFDEDVIDEELEKAANSLTSRDLDQIERYADHYGVDFDQLRDEIVFQISYRAKEGSSFTNAKNDAMEEVLDRLANNEDFDSDDEIDVKEFNKLWDSLEGAQDLDAWQDEVDKALEDGKISEEQYDELNEALDKKIDASEPSKPEKLIRKRPDGQWEVSIGDNEWEEVSEDEIPELKEAGYEEIDYEEEPEEDTDILEALDNLIDLVPEDQKEAAKKIKEKILGNSRKA